MWDMPPAIPSAAVLTPLLQLVLLLLHCRHEVTSNKPSHSCHRAAQTRKQNPIKTTGPLLTASASATHSKLCQQL